MGTTGRHAVTLLQALYHIDHMQPTIINTLCIMTASWHILHCHANWLHLQAALNATHVDRLQWHRYNWLLCSTLPNMLHPQPTRSANIRNCALCRGCAM